MSLNNWGPLTTVYSPPTSCISTITAEAGYGFFQGHYGGVVDTACYPPVTVPSSNLQSGNYWDNYYYSPGLLCPGGYSTATTYTTTTGVLPLGSGTTFALYCPSQYYLNTEYDHGCLSNASSGQAITYFDTASSLQTTTLTAPTIVSGDGIPMIWQSADLKLASASSASAALSSSIKSATAPATSVPSPPKTSLAIAASSSAASKAGLSTGSAIGLGVGIILGAIAILLLGVALWYIKRKKARGQLEPAKSNGAVPSHAEWRGTTEVLSPEKFVATEFHDAPELRS